MELGIPHALQTETAEERLIYIYRDIASGRVLIIAT